MTFYTCNIADVISEGLHVFKKKDLFANAKVFLR